jgi:hypothetical protein
MWMRWCINTGGEIMKSYKELGITFQEFGALLGVRCMLANGSLHKGPPTNQEPITFDLAYACRQDGCGSIGCIGGSMGLVMGMTHYTAHDYVMCNKSEPLHELFFPQGDSRWSHDYHKVTEEMAVEAIDRFLNGKKPWTATNLKKMRC